MHVIRELETYLIHKNSLKQHFTQKTNPQVNFPTQNRQISKRDDLGTWAIKNSI